MNDREWLLMEEALRSLREEEATTEEYAAVRGRTLARVRRERNVRWAWALAAAAGVMLVCSAVWFARPVAPQVKTVVAAVPAPATLDNRSLAVTARKSLPRRDAAKPAQRPEPMKIHFLTDDPDIVIVWLVGEEGDL